MSSEDEKSHGLLLSNAIKAQNFDDVRYFLNLGHDPLKKDAHGRSPLVRAVETNNCALVRLLLSYSNIPVGKRGSEALSLAKSQQQDEIVRWLVHYGTRLPGQ